MLFVGIENEFANKIHLWEINRLAERVIKIISRQFVWRMMKNEDGMAKDKFYRWRVCTVYVWSINMVAKMSNYVFNEFARAPSSDFIYFFYYSLPILCGSVCVCMWVRSAMDADCMFSQ